MHFRYIAFGGLNLRLLDAPTGATRRRFKEYRREVGGRGRDQKLGDFFITLRISQDGTCRIDVRGSSLYEGPSKFSGTASVYEGKFWFRSDIPWMNGSATLYKGEKEHLLVFISDDASTKVDLQLSFR